MSISPFASVQARLANADKLSAEQVPELVAAIVASARRCGASDLHFEPRADFLSVRVRIDGCLADALEIRGALRSNFIQRVKVLAGLMTYRTDIPQEGRMALDASTARDAQDENVNADARVSVYPTVHGERAVLRFFPTHTLTTGNSGPNEIDALGLKPAETEKLKNLIERPQGMILLTGPAGSGKSTTLYACIRHLQRRWNGRRHIVTVEDPPERIIDGVTQTAVNPAAGLDFAGALRALLRQDPEILMCGEIRDGETARIAAHAALTGHLLLSTIHAGSPAEVLARLAQLGVEAPLVASIVSGILAQRLLRKACVKCRAEAGGCDACGGTGYRGRMLLAELLIPNEPMRQALRENAHLGKLSALAVSAGCEGLWARGLVEVSAGTTTLEELRRVLVSEA